MPVTFLNRTRGSGNRAFDADVLSWRDAVVANGGSVSLARLIVVDQFVFSEKASGAWDLTDDYLGFWAENAIQALTSLKQRRLATAVNSPAFTPDRDYAFNGTTSYVDTGYVPSTNGIAYSGINQRLAVYERTNVSVDTSSMGVSEGSNNRALIRPRATNATMRAWLNTSVGTPAFLLPANNSQGLTAASRANSLTTVLAYKNGIRLTDATGLTGATNIQGIAIFVGGQNSNGVPAELRACSVGLAAWGAPLSDTQELAQYNAVQAWATSVGAQV